MSEFVMVGSGADVHDIVLGWVHTLFNFLEVDVEAELAREREGLSGST